MKYFLILYRILSKEAIISVLLFCLLLHQPIFPGYSSLFHSLLIMFCVGVLITIRENLEKSLNKNDIDYTLKPADYYWRYVCYFIMFCEILYISIFGFQHSYSSQTVSASIGNLSCPLNPNKMVAHSNKDQPVDQIIRSSKTG